MVVKKKVVAPSVRDIVRRVASRGIRYSEKDPVSGAKVTQATTEPGFLMFHKGKVAQTDTQRDAIKILTHIRKYKRFPASVTVFF